VLVLRCIVSSFWNSSVRLHRTNVGLTTLEVNQSNYRIIISEYGMPAVNGIELLSRIKEINPTVVESANERFRN
jgi:DNA-binding NarL/FixJ family response regulator